ncbi:MAG: tetratricopeptide repeat protein [Okeania sp. SIO2C9]|nr:tetratricopeptide repeat protein [Okeania sp. SIO2C9]
MKLYQLTTTAIITLVSIIGNPLESFSQKKFFIPSALGQDSWVNSPNRREITEKTSDGEIFPFLTFIQAIETSDKPISTADKKAIIEDLEKIELFKKNSPGIPSSVICKGYNIAEAWEKAVKACERSLISGDFPGIYHPIHQAYFGAKKYKKAINSLKKSLNQKSQNFDNDYARSLENAYTRYSHLSYQRLGLIYFKLGNYTESIKQYKKGIDSIDKHLGKPCKSCFTDPFTSSLSSIHGSIGFSLLRQGKINEAEKEFLEAMKNDKKLWQTTVIDILPTLPYGRARDSLASLLGAFCFIAPAFWDLFPSGLKARSTD